MGSMIERPPGSRQWRLRVHVGGGQYATRSFRGSERDARKALARLEVDLIDRRAPRPSADTVAQLLSDWWEQKAWKSVGGRRQAREELDRYLIPRLGDHRLSKLEDRHIAALYSGLRSGELSRSGKSLGPATIRRLHNTLRAALNWGVRKGRLGRNPAVYVDVPTVPPTRVRGPEPDELDRLLAEADRADPALAVFVRVAVATGRRRGDILGLTTADLRVGESALIFERRAVLDRKGAGVVVEDLDKNGRSARVDIDAVTMDRLSALIEERRRRARRLGATWPKGGFVFSDDPLGQLPWRPDATSREFRVLRDAAGVTTTLHGLRHGHITDLLEEGLDVEAVAKRVGDNPMTIYNTYAHRRRTADRRAASIMDRRLNGADRHLTALDGGAAE